MEESKAISVNIPVELAIALSEMKDTYAPLLRSIGQICFDELYIQKINTEK